MEDGHEYRCHRVKSVGEKSLAEQARVAIETIRQDGSGEMTLRELADSHERLEAELASSRSNFDELAKTNIQLDANVKALLLFEALFKDVEDNCTRLEAELALLRELEAEIRVCITSFSSLSWGRIQRTLAGLDDFHRNVKG